MYGRTSRSTWCAWKGGQNKTEAREAYSRMRRSTWWLVDGIVPNNLTVGHKVWLVVGNGSGMA